MFYISERQAKKLGFTHHGSYYGLPVWIGFDGMGELSAGCKVPMCDFIMTLFHHIEGFMNYTMGREQMFMFKVGKEIED